MDDFHNSNKADHNTRDTGDINETMVPCVNSTREDDKSEDNMARKNDACVKVQTKGNPGPTAHKKSLSPEVNEVTKKVIKFEALISNNDT